MNIKGKVIAEQPTTSGTSAQGNEWTKGGFVLETDGQYPKKIAFEVFNKPDVLGSAQIGAGVDVSFDIESREYNAKYYTTLRAYKVEVTAPAAPAINYGAPVPPPF